MNIRGKFRRRGNAPAWDALQNQLEKAMARYFIDLRNTGSMARDDEGAEFAHLEDALTEAKDSARDLVRQFMESRTPLGETCVEVRDTQGRVVAALTVAEVLEHPVHPAFKQNCSDLPRSGHR